MVAVPMVLTTESSHADLVVAIHRRRGINNCPAGDHAVGGVHVLCDAESLAVVRQVQGHSGG